MTDYIFSIALDDAVTAFNWGSVDISSITSTANSLSATVAPVVVTITGLLVGFKLWKRFTNKI